MCGKYFKRKYRIAKHIQIKHENILVPGQRYQDSRHLFQNPKVSKNIMGFNNHAQRSTPPYYLDVDNPLTISFYISLVLQICWIFNYLIVIFGIFLASFVLKCSITRYLRYHLSFCALFSCKFRILRCKSRHHHRD